MDIVHVPLETALIPNDVFPIASLPQTIFSLGSVGKRNTSLPDGTGKATFEHLEAAREIVISGGSVLAASCAQRTLHEPTADELRK